MSDMNETKDIAFFLFKEKVSAHIDTKDSNFYNGMIIELNKTFLVIRDRKIGQTPIAFSEIKIIERFRG